MIEPYYYDDHVTLYCADALDQRVARLWCSGDVLVTDPPYGMGFTSGMVRSPMRGAFDTCEIEGDDDPGTRDLALQLWDGDRPALVFGRWSVPKPARTRMVLTWEKGNHVGMGDLSLPWKPNTEEIYVLGTGFEGKRGTSVLKHHAIAGTVGFAARGSRVHPMEKPVALMRELLSKCPPEWTIVDPFAGSGPVLRAAKDLRRKAIGVEIVEEYCEAAARRLGQEVLNLD